MLHDSGINRVLQLLNIDLTQIALGTGTQITESATQLATETVRKTVTTSVIDGTALVKEVFFDETQANGTFTELGLLGNGATTAAGSGQLFASGRASFVKDSTQSLTISFEIEVKEVI
jgi:hypothetical protein